MTDKKYTVMYEGKEWLQPFIQSEHAHYSQEDVGEIQAFVQAKLDSAEFKANPQAALKAWAKERGDTEELRIPEDPGWELIKHILQSTTCRKSSGKKKVKTV